MGELHVGQQSTVSGQQYLLPDGFFAKIPKIKNDPAVLITLKVLKMTTKKIADKMNFERSLCRFKVEHNGVHAEPLARRGRTIIKQVAEVAVAPPAQHFRPHHVMR